MTIKAVGLINTIFGLKLYILYKIKGTFNISHLANKGQKNIIILIFITCVVYAAVIFYYLKTYELLALSLSPLDYAAERNLYNEITTTRFNLDKGADAFLDIFSFSIAVLTIRRVSVKFKVGDLKASLLLKIKNFHTRTKAINRIGPHNQDVLSVLVGLLLGTKKFFLSSNSKSFSNVGPSSSCLITPGKLDGLKPYWVTGFSDGKTSFIISITKSNTHPIGWRVTPIFSIELGSKDISLLNKIKNFFGVGSVITRSSLRNKNLNTNSIYSVKSIDHISNVIIPHFNQYPLLTKKKLDFDLFKKIVELINKGDHLTTKGLIEILIIKKSLNKGLPGNLVNLLSILSIEADHNASKPNLEINKLVAPITTNPGVPLQYNFAPLAGVASETLNPD